MSPYVTQPVHIANSQYKYEATETPLETKFLLLTDVCQSTGTQQATCTSVHESRYA
jgi:hypothetical protein